MGIQRVDDKTGEVLMLPYYRVHVLINKIVTQDVNGLPVDNPRVKEVLSDLTLKNANVVLTAMGRDEGLTE